MVASRVDSICRFQESDDPSHLETRFLWTYCRVDGFCRHPFCSLDLSKDGILDFPGVV